MRVTSFVFLAISMFVAGFSSLPTAFAQGLDPKEIRGTQKAEQQPISVLQQRFFLKAKRPEFGLVAGSLLNEAYTKTTTFGLRGAFFMNEWIGAEAQWITTSVSDSDDRKALNTLKYHRRDYTGGTANNELVSPDPEINSIHHMIDTNIVAAPFYGKLDFLDLLIVYTDIYVSTGLSRVETDQGTLNAFLLGVGERFYLLDRWSLRVDFRDRIYTEQRAGDDSRKNLLSIDFGVSYFIL